MSDTIYQYLEVPAPHLSKNPGVICCRIERPAKNDPKAVYKVSFSFCSPLDNFSKKEAHAVTTHRKTTGSYVTVKLKNKRPPQEVVFYALRKLWECHKNVPVLHGLIPKWALNNVSIKDDKFTLEAYHRSTKSPLYHPVKQSAVFNEKD